MKVNVTSEIKIILKEKEGVDEKEDNFSFY